MTDLYQTEISTISMVVLFKAGGSILGASVAGIMLDKFLHQRYFMLFAYTLGMGITNAVLPHLSQLWIFFCVSTLTSLSSGSLASGGNVLILDCWKGGDSGPYIHSIHFSFAIGAFVAPLIAVPFLGKNATQLQGDNFDTAQIRLEKLLLRACLLERTQLRALLLDRTQILLERTLF